MSGLGAMPVNSVGVPWNAGYIVASGNLAADFRFNVTSESQGRLQVARLYALTEDEEMRDFLPFLLARDTMHQNQWVAALAELERDGLDGPPVPSVPSVSLCEPAVKPSSPSAHQRRYAAPLAAEPPSNGTRMRTLLAALTATMVMGTLPLAAQDFRWNGRLAAGKEIEIVGVVGDIHAVASTGSQVEVVAEMSEGQVPVRVMEHGDGVTLCVVYPTTGRGRSDTSGGRCNTNGNIHNPPRVDFTVRVPAGVRFAARTVTGDVEARGLRSAVNAASVSGGVDVQTTEEAEATTVSGDLRVSMGRLPRTGSLRLHTVSGDVRVILPASASANLRINTLSGEVDSEFPLQVQARGGRGGSWGRVGQQIQATIGRGGPSLEIHTVSGDIEIQRGG